MSDDIDTDIENDPRFHIARQSRKTALELVKIILDNARDADHARELCAQWLTTQINVLMKETDWNKEVRTIKAAENRAKRAERPNPFAGPSEFRRPSPPSARKGPTGSPPKPDASTLEKRLRALHKEEPQEPLGSETPEE